MSRSFRSGRLHAGEPPRARRRSRSTIRHGRTFLDRYGWLRDPGYPRVERRSVLKLLEAENRYFDSAMAPHAALIETLHGELKARQQEDESSVPYRAHGYDYWWSFEPGAEYRHWYRRRAGGGDAELIVDEPSLAAGHRFFRLGGMDVTTSGGLLAFAVDHDGDERYVLRIRDLATDHLLDDSIGETSGAPVWLDGTHFLYVRLSPEWRPYQVRRHRIGRDPQHDEIVYEERDPAFFVDCDLTQSERFVVISAGSHTTSEERLLAVDDESLSLHLLSPRRDGVEYDVDHGGGAFYIRVNDTSPDFRLVRAPESSPSPASFEEVIPAREGLYLLGHVAFSNALVVRERIAGIDGIRIVGPSGAEHHIEFPEPLHAVYFGINAEPAVERLRLGYTSLVTPFTVYDYDIAARALATRKVQQIPSGYAPERFVATRLEAPARDGARVPISLVHRRDWQPGGPVHLLAYGAYGIAQAVAFSSARLSLLDRGFAVGLVHVRGGDELGRSWYEAGKLERRENTFDDFLAATHYLIGEGIACAGRVSLEGGSAGGTLVGVVLNREPRLWGAAVAHVPFVDVLNTMCDATLPLTPIEWPEWGNPIDDAGACERIAAYSPYDNVRRQAYPPLLATAGLNDPRVTYWEAAKWVALLRHEKTDANVLLLKTNMHAGHGGRSGRYDALRETAEEYAFILLALDVGGVVP